jgi:son of sevenless
MFEKKIKKIKSNKKNKKDTRKPNWEKFQELEFGVSDNNSPFNVLNISGKELAEQLTYIDYKYYSEIKFTEMLGQSWNKEKKRFMAPNLMRSINFLNKISGWVAVQILTENNLEKRVKIVKYFLKVLPELVNLNSLNMIQAVNSALSGSAIHRLNNTWEQIEEKEIQERTKVDELISTRGNFKNLRNTMSNCYDSGKECSPFIGILLKDLVFFDDGNPKLVDGKINFNKCIGFFSIMKNILRFQKRDFNIIPNPKIIKSIVEFKPMDEKILYNMSLQLQPRKEK